MKRLFAITLVCFAAFAGERAMAQGFPLPAFPDPGETCYSWNGGHKSAGSFSRCSPAVIVAIAPPPPPAPVLMQSPVCPPQVILEPEPKKPVAKPRPRPRPAPQKC